jgi:TrpR-related protein YerC/YecD
LGFGGVTKREVGVYFIMNKKLETAEMDELLRAILSLETVEEAYEFFEDLCTVNEMVAMKQRFEVAKMLREERTYQDIADETGASSATISRVNRALNYGNDGYDMVLKRIGQ